MPAGADNDHQCVLAFVDEHLSRRSLKDSSFHPAGWCVLKCGGQCVIEGVFC